MVAAIHERLGNTVKLTYMFGGLASARALTGDADFAATHLALVFGGACVTDTFWNERRISSGSFSKKVIILKISDVSSKSQPSDTIWLFPESTEGLQLTSCVAS